MRIELHIDRVVLDGIGGPHQTGAIHDAMVAELTRLVTTASREAWQETRSRRRVNASPMLLASSMPAVGIGSGIAQSVYDGLTSPTERGGQR
jgi:hypothetical protein